MTVVYYFDGGAKPNPGEMEVGLVEVIGTQKTPYHQKIGQGTNNVAEWTAILWALEVAAAAGHRRVELIGDSQLVVNQSMGNWKVRADDLKVFMARFTELRKSFDEVKVRGVPRAQNLAGRMLEGKSF